MARIQLTLVACCLFLLTWSFGVYAANGVESCVKGTFKGDASTYNPNFAGWKTGGQSLATGGKYDSNSFDAALQLDLAKRYKCGYGSGAVCHAVVQAPNGRSMIVRINDNGPLVPGRIIDLNEKSMRYLSDGKYGKNSGVVKSVTVTLLCGAVGGTLGPLNEKDREAWKNVVLNTPVTNMFGLQNANIAPFSGAGDAQFSPFTQQFGTQGSGGYGGAYSPFQSIYSGGSSGGAQTGGASASGGQQNPSVGLPLIPANANTFTGQGYQVPEYVDDPLGNSDGVENINPTVACVSSEGRMTVRWSCASGSSVSRGLSSPSDTTFSTRGALAGVVPVHPKSLTNYTVQCIKNQQIVGSASCKLKPTSAPGVTVDRKAVLSISADPENVRKGKRATITWSTIRVHSCTVYGDGLAAEGEEGEEQTEPLSGGVHIYTLECENASGDVETARARVEVR